MRVEFVGSVRDINPENDNFDVHLHLDDGRVYSFVVATPQNLFRCMDNEGVDYFVGVPPVLVKRLSADVVERALRAIVAEENGRRLDVYGTLQQP